MKFLKYMLIFIPSSIVGKFMNFSPAVMFVLAALSIVPLAGLMGEGTEEISFYSGPKIGGFLNATFGNATELKNAVVSKRTILNFSLDNFSLEKVVSTLNALKAGGIAVAGVVMDGIDFSKVSEADVKAVADYAKKENVVLWASSDSVPANLENNFSIIVNLSQTSDAVVVDIAKLNEKKNISTGLKLDSKTLLITNK